MIGIGLVTYERSSFFEVAIRSVLTHLKGVVDHIFVYDDGSQHPEYDRIFNNLQNEPVVVHRAIENKGVATAKNHLLRSMMDAGCDWLFLMEDDQEILSAGAAHEYIRFSKLSGIEHFMFAHHGPANVGEPKDVTPEGIELYPNCVGAYCMYTRNVIETVGYMDETYPNCWEHCIHTALVARAGLCPAFWWFPDVPNSRELVREQPGGIYNSAIRQGTDWAQVVEVNRRRWAKDFPEVWS